MASPLHDFQAKDKLFLETYAETLDLKQALSVSGVTRERLNSKPFLLTQVDKITNLNMYSVQAKTVVGTHYRLLEKFEKDYDTAKEEGDSKLQQGLASTLSRMTDTAMKASGDFAKSKEQGPLTNVQVVINMGDAPPEIPPPVVEIKASTPTDDNN